MKKNQILTIPNLLSLLRIVMIPQIMWLYLEKQDFGMAAIWLAISGLTDILDGIIVRKFNMVSDFGKAFDPVADKLTQLAVLCALVTRFPNMWVLVILLVVKEGVSGVMSLMAIRRSGVVCGADWHGKVTTALLYGTVGVHILWSGIPAAHSNVLVIVCAGMMLYSMAAYWRRNHHMIHEENGENEA